MRGASGLLVAAALTGAIVTGACRRHAAPPSAPPPPPRPLLGPIAVEDLSPPSDERIDKGRIQEQIRQGLATSGLFAVGASDGGAIPTARARLAFTAECVQEGAKGEARAQVRLHVDTRPSDAPGAVEFDVEAQGVEPYTVATKKAAPQPVPSLTKLVLRIAGDLINGVAVRRRLEEGSPVAVHAALVADGGELREEAIRIIGERQLRDEVPTLLKLLGDPDETVRDAALGALIAMRERRAVRALTESRSLRDRREMRKIIEAISILGGQEADEYLSFIAATHDDDEIRAAAAAARTRLQRRSEAGAGP
jgi:hypothetical protein